MKPFTLVPLSCDSHTRKLLDMALSRDDNQWCQIGDEEHAEVALIDGDRPGAMLIYQQQRERYPNRAILLMSARDLSLSGTIALSKPFQMRQLRNKLLQARHLMESGLLDSDNAPSPTPTSPAPAPPPSPAAVAAPSASSHTPLRRRSSGKPLAPEVMHAVVGQGPDVPLDDPKQRPRAFYDPKTTLQDSLQQAISAAQVQNKPVHLDTQPPILIVPEHRCAYSTLSEPRLRGLCHMPQSQPVRWHLLSPQALPADLATQTAWPLESLHWNVVLWCARGRLPLNVDPRQPRLLRHWPNFTRLQMLPQALRICALWSEAPRSPVEIARQLGIEQRAVFACYSGCAALDLFATAQEAAADPAPHIDHHNAPRRSLLRRLLSVLRGR